ncbi:hypothetical protein NM208_g11754 [Fusarium decemcellulare]|uniref:Uncharacterized protein n=1 Tax=Fusarium decemcellulare TaxID=57161 RepID=A0ACC1RTB7_9HYPO|nr:hypothetical protein NM208_g11754 [Fusarium decemcellulare]
MRTSPIVKDRPRLLQREPLLGNGLIIDTIEGLPVQNIPKHPVASRVRSSATFPPHIPINLSKPPCTIPASSTFTAPNLNQSFGTLPIRPLQQQVYYQAQPTFVPTPVTPQVPIQTPQYITGPVAGPVIAHALPAPPANPPNTQNNPKEHDHARHPPGWAEASGPYAKELQRIQKHIDGKMADLSEEPSSRVLRRDLRRLQDRLNMTLNKAIASSGGSHRRHASLSTWSNTSQQEHSPSKPPVEKTVTHHDFANQVQSSPAKDVSEETQMARTSSPPRWNGQRATSPQRVRRHHVCSECGNIRSLLFHKRYQYPIAGRLKLNLCEGCREKRVDRGIVEQYHFCFNCGCARSKSFHKQHPILPGEPILPNYCGVCRQEAQADGGLAETSVLGLDTDNEKDHAEQAGSESEEDLNSLAAQSHRTRHPSHQSVPSDVKAKSRKAPEREAEYSRVREIKLEQARSKRPDPVDPKGRVLPPNRGNETPVSSYCPTRTLGSAGRRAQRKSSGQIDIESIPRIERVETPRNYRAPYVEDPSSASHSRRGTPSPAFVAERPGQQKKQKSPEKGYVQNDDSRLKPAIVDERPSSSGSRWTRDNSPKVSSRPREKSIESDRSADSNPGSSKSSGSKTVRFKQSVDIRTTLPPDWDAELSEAENPFDNQKPSRSNSSPLISRMRQSSHGLRSQEDDNINRDYLHPHYGRSSMKSPGSCREPIRTPDSFRVGTPSKGYSQGAFSKDFGQFDEWDSFGSSREPHGDQSRESSSFRGYYDRPAQETQDNYDHYDQYMESTTSLPSFLPSGGGFGSFFNKSKNKASTTPNSRASPFQSYTSGHNFNETARDHETTFDNSHEYARSNPYYTPRKNRFPNFSFYGSAKGSEKSMKRDNAPSSPGKSDEFFWNNGFDPIPTVEEASSICDFSHDEGPTDLLEYHVVSDSSSLETEDEEEAHSDRDYSTSDEETDENAFASPGKLLLPPTVTGNNTA